MVKKTDMITALVTAFQTIPELIPYLANGDPNMIAGYLDAAPTPLSLARAVQNVPDGAIMVAWMESELNHSEEMSNWLHRFNFYLRVVPGQSALDMVDTLMDGVPSGQNLRWRYMQLLQTIYPNEVLLQTRETDAQDIDYFVISAELKETGDF